MTDVPSLSSRIGRELLDRLVDVVLDGSAGKVIRDRIAGHLADHLAQLRELGVVRPFDALPNRRMNLVRSWNVMCGVAQDTYSTQARETLEIARTFDMALVVRLAHDIAWKAKDGSMDPERREAAMLDMMARMDAGDARWWYLSGTAADFVSGEEFSYEMRGWNLVVGRMQDRRDALAPAEDLEPTTLHEVEIDLPTGSLLVADWFRADGFTDMVDEGQPWRGGSQAENERDAERYVRDHGFASVASIRRSLAVLTDGTSITVGHHDEDGEHPLPTGYRRVDDMLIDLRKVSLADRASLVTTLSRVHEAGRAAALVDELADDGDVVSLEVAPGRYRVVSSGRGYIEDLLEDGHPLKVPGYEPVMILERV
jgi:hypothetical protein